MNNWKRRCLSTILTAWECDWNLKGTLLVIRVFKLKGKLVENLVYENLFVNMIKSTTKLVQSFDFDKNYLKGGLESGLEAFFI